MNPLFAVATKSLSVFTMMYSISLVSTENTPIQNIWFHHKVRIRAFPHHAIPHTSWAGCRR